MSEYIWETFDNLFKTVGRQGRRVEDLEARIVELERRLAEATTTAAPRHSQTKQPLNQVQEMPAERAA